MSISMRLQCFIKRFIYGVICVIRKRTQSLLLNFIYQDIRWILNRKSEIDWNISPSIVYTILITVPEFEFRLTTWFLLLFADGDENQENLRGRPFRTNYTGGREELLRTIRTGKLNCFFFLLFPTSNYVYILDINIKWITITLYEQFFCGDKIENDRNGTVHNLDGVSALHRQLNCTVP